MTEVLIEYFADATRSEFFAAGLALGVVGCLATVLRSFWRSLAGLIRRRALVSVEITNQSPAYRAFCVWLDSTGVLAHARRVRVTEIGRGGSVYVPAPGRHWFRHQGVVAIFHRAVSDKQRTGQTQRPLETLTITLILGRVATVRGWIAEGGRLVAARDRIGPGLHVLRDGYWDHCGDVTGRALDSVLVDDERLERLLADVRWFYDSRGWYQERGVPWRRGYLLYGPPGTGKSSAVRAIASELRRDIAILDVGRASLTDDALGEAMSSAPGGSLIVIEDVDAVFAGRGAGERRSGVSFSGLLNAIDGVAAQEGRALFMTTNHRDRLDPALIRPGRADLHVELGPVSAAAAARLFARFFPGEEAHAAAFREALGAARVTPAVLQGWLLQHIGDPEAAARAGELAETPLLAAE